MKIYAKGKKEEKDMGISELLIENDLSKDIKIIVYNKKNLTKNEADLMAIAHALLLSSSFSTIYTNSQWCVLLLTEGALVKERKLHLIVSLIHSVMKTKIIKLKYGDMDKRNKERFN